MSVEKKIVKLSHSAMNMYADCPRSYYFRYVEKLVSKSKGSALYFGIAVDKALEHMLQNKDKGEEALNSSFFVFDENWVSQPDNSKKTIKLKGNDAVAFSKHDFDTDLMTEEDWKEILKLRKTLKLDKDPVEIRERLYELKKLGGEVNKKELKLSNLMSWLSLRRKAYILVRGYYEQILPLIKEVVTTQVEVEMTSPDGDIVRGFVDLVGRLQDDTVVVFDNKTSSIDYAADSVRTSEQLALYKALLTEYVNTENAKWSVPVDKAGYLVLNKKIVKVISKTCQSCGHVAVRGARHETCNAMISGKRCNGKWTKKLEGFECKTQVIIDDISEEMLDKVMDRINSVNQNIKSEIFDENRSNCIKPWGKCDYYDICHHGDFSKVIQNKEIKK